MVLAKIRVKALKTEKGPPDHEEDRRGLRALLPNIEGTKQEARCPLVGLTTPRTQSVEPNEFGSKPKKDDGNTHAVADTHTNTFLAVNPKQILCPRVAVSAVNGACWGIA